MSTDPERQLDKLIVRHAGRPPDQHTRDALARARRDAVSRAGRRPEVPAYLAPAGAFALSAVLALGLAQRGGERTAPPTVVTDPVAQIFVYAAEDAALVEDLDFYRWLDARDHAG